MAGTFSLGWACEFEGVREWVDSTSVMVVMMFTVEAAEGCRDGEGRVIVRPLLEAMGFSLMALMMLADVCSWEVLTVQGNRKQVCVERIRLCLQEKGAEQIEYLC